MRVNSHSKSAGAYLASLPELRQRMRGTIHKVIRLWAADGLWCGRVFMPRSEVRINSLDVGLMALPDGG
jgi:hypothetical protein